MRRSVGIPLALGIGLAILVLLLAVGWQILVLDDPRPLTQGLSTRDWLMLILGTLFFVLVLAGLVALSAWLVREMRLNQRQRAFLDAVTHEMRTPLASLRLYLDTLGRHDPDPEQRRAFLGRMQRDVDRLDHTVEQVLHAARAEEHRRGPPAEQVMLVPLLDECIEELRARHELPASAVQLDARAPHGGARQSRRARGGVPQPARERREVLRRPGRDPRARVAEGRRPRRRRDLGPRDRNPRARAAQDLPALLPRRPRRAAHRGRARTRPVHRAQPRAAPGRARGGAQRGLRRRQPLRRHAARGAASSPESA